MIAYSYRNKDYFFSLIRYISIPSYGPKSPKKNVKIQLFSVYSDADEELTEKRIENNFKSSSRTASYYYKAISKCLCGI